MSDGAGCRITLMMHNARNMGGLEQRRSGLSVLAGMLAVQISSFLRFLAPYAPNSTLPYACG